MRKAPLGAGPCRTPEQEGPGHTAQSCSLSPRRCLWAVGPGPGLGWGTDSCPRFGGQPARCSPQPRQCLTADGPRAPVTWEGKLSPPQPAGTFPPKAPPPSQTSTCSMSSGFSNSMESRCLQRAFVAASTLQKFPELNWETPSEAALRERARYEKQNTRGYRSTSPRPRLETAEIQIRESEGGRVFRSVTSSFPSERSFL